MQVGAPLPPETLAAVRSADATLKGPTATPSGTGFRSVNVELRQKLQLYANYRPARSMPGVPSRYEDVDLIVVRENTEGLYSGLEHEVVPGVVESLRVVTETASERIARFAFETARRQGRKRVTCVHKANILKLSDGLFLRTCRRVAEQLSRHRVRRLDHRRRRMKLVINPHSFDVMVMENLFGDIVSDLTAGLVGGLGLTPSANVGHGVAVFEAVHGSAPDIAGKGLANPTALILSAVLMLRYLSEKASRRPHRKRRPHGVHARRSRAPATSAARRRRSNTSTRCSPRCRPQLPLGCRFLTQTVRKLPPAPCMYSSSFHIANCRCD